MIIKISDDKLLIEHSLESEHGSTNYKVQVGTTLLTQ